MKKIVEKIRQGNQWLISFVMVRTFLLSSRNLHAAASCGVSLALKDYDRCRYVIEQFKDLWIEYLTGVK